MRERAISRRSLLQGSAALAALAALGLPLRKVRAHVSG